MIGNNDTYHLRELGKEDAFGLARNAAVKNGQLTDLPIYELAKEAQKYGKFNGMRDGMDGSKSL